MISFWCKNCKLDFDSDKVFNGIDRFEAKCLTCNKVCLRIKDPKQDNYFHLSKRVKIERDKHKIDLIQYGEAGFKTFYHDQWQKFEKQREDYETKQRLIREEREALYRKYKHDPTAREVIKKSFQAEDQLRSGTYARNS